MNTPPTSPKNAPFANFITAYTTNVGSLNEQHITFETRNGNWLAGELNAPITGTFPLANNCAAICATTGITGSDHICAGTPQQYSVPYYTNVTYHWTAPTGTEILSGQDTHSIQLSYTNSGISSGSLVCHAAVTNCGDVTLTKPIDMGFLYGLPQIYINGTPYTGASNFTLQRFSQFNLTVDPVAGATGYYWSIGNNATLDSGQGTNSVWITTTGSNGSSLSFSVQPVNICGNGGGTAINGTIGGNDDGGILDFVYYPNPAGNELTVQYQQPTAQSKQSTLSAKSSIVASVTKKDFNIKLLNSQGKVLRQAVNTTADNSVLVDTHNIPNGTYYLHIFDGDKVIKKQIIIQH